MGLEAPRTDYLGSNISTTCNSAGSALWALTKNMKPLVDANCHTEAIELANDRSPIQFSPIFYKNPGSNSEHPAGQTILFGCPPELRTDGQQKKVPLILEFLLTDGTYGESYSGVPVDQCQSYWGDSVGQCTDMITNNSLYGRCKITGL